MMNLAKPKWQLLMILPSTERGGAEEYALTIVSAAVAEGWDVHIAFPKRGSTASLVQIREFPDLRLVWVGDGEERENLVTKVQEYGVEDQVLFLGYRSDIPKLLIAADLFIFPSRFEGQPFALIEAMAHGLPIVASDTCGIPELIEHGVHGLLFRTSDSCDLLETTRWALRHPEEMQQMAINAKLHAKEFSEEKMVKETLSVLHKLSYEP